MCSSMCERASGSLCMNGCIVMSGNHKYVAGGFYFAVFMTKIKTQSAVATSHRNCRDSAPLANANTVTPVIWQQCDNPNSLSAQT